MEESRENKWVKMKAAGIEAGSPAAKRFMRDYEEAESMQKLTDKEIKIELLKESIKQTKHSESISNNVKFFFYFALLSITISIIAALIV